ncbi:MAG: Mth938-like domain-containing protein [Proteobacteria bacterium]|nr:Mth938-like domain-containing protein [Pseudomonadota bacterium]
MKLHADLPDTHSVTGYGPGWIAVGGERIETSLIVGSRGERLPWPCRRFEDLTPAHFEQLATLDAELVIFGSGERLRFPPPPWLAALMAKRIGLETMDTAAACRTYNILAGEGRHVVAALLIEPVR